MKTLTCRIYNKLCLLCLGLLTTFSVQAQFSHAAHLIVSGDYEGARLYYLKVLDKDSTNFSANQELGLLLLQYFDDKEGALVYLNKAVKHVVKRELLPELYLGFAQSLHFGGLYNDAITYYEKILASTASNAKGLMIRKQALLSIEQCKYALKNPATKSSLLYHVKNAGPGINTAYPEMMAVVDPGNTTLLYSAKKNIILGEKKDGIQDRSRGDMYIANNTTGKFEYGLPFFKQNYQIKFLESTADHDHIISISGNGKRLLLCRADQLYLTEEKDGVWTPPVILPPVINTSPNFEGHACISNDGKTIYFSMTKAGGYGGKDLYKSVLTESGIWTEPENLGEDINTAEDDDSPFLTADEKTFYYSSNGPNSYGGFDVYKAIITEKGISKPVNMGLPLNSPVDDLYFSMNADGSEGYLTSSRKGGVGDMDIYRVFYYGKPSPANCITINGPKPTDNAYIDFSLRDSIFVNDSVLFDAKISAVKGGRILNYFWKINDTTAVSDTSAFTKKFVREGKYIVSLEAAVANDTSDYRLDYCVSKELHVFSPKAIDDFFEPLIKKDEDKLPIAGTVDVSTIKLDSAKKEIVKIKLEPLFFNSNQFDLRKDAVAAIKRNIAKMKVDPTIVVKLTARTDTRSSKEYNLSLSQKRANTVVAYLEKNGIKKKRIIAVLAVGEQDAAIDGCGNDAACWEKIAQKNRRVEFKIVGAEYEAPKMAKLVKKAAPAKKTAAKKSASAKKKK